MNSTDQDSGSTAGNDRDQDPSAAAASSYRQQATRLVNQNILPLWSSARNVWRTAWAMDTLIDYFSILGLDSSVYGDDAMQALNPMNRGSWWDDFGWIGIAALRAAEQGFVPARRDDFLKIAINAWAYMHGPGWSLAPTTAVYPFTDLPGWDEFAVLHASNTGAPNVWNQIDKTRPNPANPPNAWIAPRFTNGGVWNSPVTTSEYPAPVPQVQTYWDQPYLNPAQNTVTNSVYTLLSLRLYQASRNPAFAQLFRASGVSAAAAHAAWTRQVNWFNSWIVDTIPAQSLLLKLPGAALVRERVSTFYPQADRQGLPFWDAMFRQNLAWTGDQGLVLGLMRESYAQWNSPAPMPPSLRLYPQLLEGVFSFVFKPRSYAAQPGSYPLPWLDAAASDPYTALPPGQTLDASDYLTGVAVFMRYALQAYRADPALLTPYRNAIFASANGVVRSGFGQGGMPVGDCDAFAPAGGTPEDQMTSYVNSLSVLLLAIQMGG